MGCGICQGGDEQYCEDCKEEWLKLDAEIKLELDSELRVFLKYGMKISAIKIYKGATNCSLSDAKDYCDNL